MNEKWNDYFKGIDLIARLFHFINDTWGFIRVFIYGIQEALSTQKILITEKIKEQILEQIKDEFKLHNLI